MLRPELFEQEVKLAMLSQRLEESMQVLNKLFQLRKKLLNIFGTETTDVLWKDIQGCSLVFSWQYARGSFSFSLMRFADGSTYLDYKEVGKDTILILNKLEKMLNSRLSQKTIRIN